MFTNKDLRRLILPLIVEQLLAVTIGMADTMMVASVGEQAVSGLALVDTINILLINIFAALATGGAVVAAQFLGMRNEKSACKSAKQLLLSTLVISTIIMIIALIGCTNILQLAFGEVDPLVMNYAKTYFMISAISYPFIALYNSGAALFRSMGNSKISMCTSLIMNIMNIIGNAILIFGFGMGVAGAAISSLVSRIFGATLMLIILKNKNNSIYIDSYRRLEVDTHLIKKILHIGIPNGVENGMFQFGKILVQGLIASFGTIAIASNALAQNIAMMETIPAAAIGLSLITIVGQCVGANDYEQAKYYIRKLLKLAYLSMAIVSLVILLFSKQILGLYGLSLETTNLSWLMIALHSIFGMLLWPASFTLPNAFRASNDAKFTMSVSIVSMLLVRIGVAYIYCYTLGLGVIGVWLAMFTDWLVRVIFFTFRLHNGKWMKKRLV
ncbi:MAG: MATE family efflux transporter [Erysipelotrichaceae bacterium]